MITDEDAVILPELADELITGITKTSVALTLGRKVPTTTRDTRMPVLTEAPEAYWVSGDTGLKQTSKAAWTGEALIAEEMATIVPIPDAVFEDAKFPIWEALRPLLVRAMARTLDNAVLFGTNAPASWPISLYEDAVAAGNTITAGSDPIPSVLDAAEVVAADGYIPTGAVVRPGWQYKAASVRSDSLVANPAGASSPYPMTLAGLGIYTDPPRWQPALAEAIVADWTNVLVGIRKDFTVKMFDTGVIQDETGAIVANLMQQDTSAMRAVMRVGYLLAKPVTDVDVENPSPAAVVWPATLYAS
jgi:HK97 family phage major capsid protein